MLYTRADVHRACALLSPPSHTGRNERRLPATVTSEAACLIGGHADAHVASSMKLAILFDPLVESTMTNLRPDAAYTAVTRETSAVHDALPCETVRGPSHMVGLSAWSGPARRSV